MKHLFRTALLLLCLFSSLLLKAQVNELPRSTPEAEGVSSKALIEMFDSLMALPDTEIHSVMAVRHGKVIGEIYPQPFAPQYQHTMYSCSKTFVAAAIGLAIDENRLRLTDRVATFFPEHLPDSISDNLAAMTVADLLTMRSGIRPDWNMRNKTPDWLRVFLSKPIEEPGTKFQYDSMVTYTLSAIVQRVTGMTMLDYLQQKLFTPMNITKVGWELSPEGINTGGWGLHIQSESLAKFGLLLMNGGKWNGEQLLSAEWVKEMTSSKVPREDGEDYAYQTWICDFPGAIRADGALGQFVIMIPEKELLFVITECSLLNGKPQRNQFWKLVPKVGDAALAPSKEYQRLQKKQAAYTLPVVKGKRTSKAASAWEGKTILLEKNKLGWQSLSLESKDKELLMTVVDKEGKQLELPLGYRRWQTTKTDSYPPYSITPIDCFKGLEKEFYVAGSYAWPSSDVWQAKLHYANWVTSLDLELRQVDGTFLLTIKENYSRKPFEVKGRLAD